jgi:Ca2+-binding EF-hand superfamily protein
MNPSRRTHFRTSRARLAGLVALLIGSAGPALAQQPAVQPPAGPPAAITSSTQLLLSRLTSNTTLKWYLEILRNDFFQLDANSDGKLNRGDIDLHELMESIQRRTFALSFVMRFDLDSDGAVTEDEIRRAMRYELRAQLSQAAADIFGKPRAMSSDALEKQIDNTVHSIMALDVDKDGKVSFAEASKFSLPGMGLGLGLGQNGQSARIRQVLALEAGSKGEITLPDYQDAGEALFRKIDSDGDGKVSQQELADYRRQPGSPDAAIEAVQQGLREQVDAARNRDEAARVQCDMPAASEKAKVVVLGGYETDALSSVTLGSQDTLIHAGRVVVEPGDDPLYVVIATFSPAIWQFSGAVERIERVVLSSERTGPNGNAAQQPPLVGATGLVASRISIFPRWGCLRYFSETPSGASLLTVAAIRRATGKEPSVVTAKYSIGSVAVPSGKIETLQDDRQPLLVIQKGQGTLNITGDSKNVIVQAGPSRARDDLSRYFPGGVLDIDPKAVVASAAAEAYQVLPAQGGLVQLLSTGALTQNGSGEYIIRQKIRFPAGLYGANAVTFLVLKGAPYPDGDPGHSCVIREDNGEKKGAICRQ